MRRSFKSCIQPDKETKQREMALQQKVGSLTANVQRLERSMASLRAENEIMRRKLKNQSIMEDTISQLKNRNSELTSNVKKLVEKIEQINQETEKKKTSSLPQSEVNPEVEHLKRVFAKQRAKDLSEYKRLIETKDKEIEGLRMKCQGPGHVEHLSNSEMRVYQNVIAFPEQDEFVNIIKMAAKERLQFELQLSRIINKEEHPVTEKINEFLPLSKEISETKHQAQHPDNDESMTKQQKNNQDNGPSHTKKHSSLSNNADSEMKYKKQRSEKYQSENDDQKHWRNNVDSEIKQHNFRPENNDLQKKQHKLSLENDLSENKQRRRRSENTDSETEKHRHRSDSNDVNTKQYKYQRENNDSKTTQTNYHNDSSEAKKHNYRQENTDSEAEQQSRRLEAKQQKNRPENSESEAKQNSRRSDNNDLGSKHHNRRLDNTDSGGRRQNRRAENTSSDSEQRNHRPDHTDSEDKQQNRPPQNEVPDDKQQNRSPQNEGPESNQSERRLNSDQSQTEHHREHTKHELSKTVSDSPQQIYPSNDIQGQIQDVSKVADECNTLKLSLTTAQKEKEAAEEEVKLLSRRIHSLESVVRDLQDSAEHVIELENYRKTTLQQLKQKQDQLEELQKVNSSNEFNHMQTVVALNKMVAGLENKIRAEEKNRLELTTEVQRLQREAAERDKILAELENAKREKLQEQHKIDFVPVSKRGSVDLDLICESLKFADEEEDDENIEVVEEVSKKRIQRKSLNHNDQHEDESLLLAWAQKGPIQVYIAKYNYDPFELSPNENPEAELTLTAGDYVLVVGEMDEDGFFDGELIDGTQGLVPSNFIQKVEAEAHLLQFHQALLHAGHKDYSDIAHKSVNLTMPTTTIEPSPVIYSGRKNIYNNSSKDFDFSVEDQRDHLKPPCPHSLSIDKRLVNSMQISWRGPEPVPGIEVQSYRVLVDGETATLVKKNERTQVMLEGISPNDIHRISVLCLSNRGVSMEAQCTILVGKDAYPAPSELKATFVSPTSTSISWLPGNSNYQHSIVVNEKEVAVVKPGVFNHTLSGLIPATVYKVTLIAKSISGILNEVSTIWERNASSSVAFTTPEADNAASGTEHLQDIQSFLLPVYANSVSELRSTDTEPLLLSMSLKTTDDQDIDLVKVTNPEPQNTTDVEELKSQCTADVEELKSEDTADAEEVKSQDTDEEIEEAFRDYSNQGDAVTDSYSGSSCTELSDIPEVEEDLIDSNDSNINELGFNMPNQIPSLSQVVNQLSKEMPATIIPSQANNIKLSHQNTKQFEEGIQHISAEANLEDEKRDSSPSKQNFPTSSSIEKPDTESVWQGQKNAQNTSDNSLQDQSYQKNIDSAQMNDMETKSNEKYNDTHSVSQGSRTNLVTSHNSHFRHKNSKDDLISQKFKNNLGQRPLSDSAIVFDNTPDETRQSSSPILVVEDASDSSLSSGETDPIVKANSVRLFIALFDYDPISMSPNVDSIDEELPFREGQILKVFGHKDADGFYKGENNGRIGYIPCNMVCRVQIDDPELLSQLLHDTTEYPGHIHYRGNNNLSDGKQWISNGGTSITRADLKPRQMIAIYDYDPKVLSPNVDSDLELSFKAGDHVTIYGDMDSDGFYTGVINKRRGLVPSNFLRPAPAPNNNMLGNTTPTARSPKDLDMAQKVRNGIAANNSNLDGHLSSHPITIDSNRQKVNVNLSEIKSGGARSNVSSPADDEKSKKDGFLSRGKSIFKIFTR